jgi:nitroreductase
MQIDELLKLIKERRSIREFNDEKISNDEIKILIDAARYAPSNNNRQAWKFIILKNDKIKKEIAETVNKKLETIENTIENQEVSSLLKDYQEFLLFFTKAPVIIFALYKISPFFFTHVCKKAMSNNANYQIAPEIISVSMAIQNLLLAAHSIGLGACCTTAPLYIASEEIKSILKVAIPYEIAALIPIGKYAKMPEKTSRKDINKIIDIIE